MSWASAIQAAGDIAGGLISATANRKSQERDQNFQKEQAEKDRAWQRELATSGIRMRVNDAVKAGLHPLVGAGVTPYQGSPIGISGSPGHADTMGQSISRAVSAVASSFDKETRELQLEQQRAAVEKDEAMALYYDALAGKARQEWFQSTFLNSRTVPDNGQVTITPPAQYVKDKGDKSRVAGEHALFGKFNITPELVWDLPYSPGESPFESMEGIVPQALVLYKNLIYPAKQKYQKIMRRMNPSSFNMMNWLYQRGKEGK